MRQNYKKMFCVVKDTLLIAFSVGVLGCRHTRHRAMTLNIQGNSYVPPGFPTSAVQ